MQQIAVRLARASILDQPEPPPLSEYATTSFGFTILRFDHDAASDVVYVEDYTDASYLDRLDAVRSYSTLWDRPRRPGAGLHPRRLDNLRRRRTPHRLPPLAGIVMTEDRDGVVVYWRPGCPYCMKLRLRLRFTRLKYTEVNIWKDPAAAAFVRSVADGNETVPTVTVAGEAMVNPSKRRVLEAVKTHAPHLLPRT